jgi:hypothetical protein
MQLRLECEGEGWLTLTLAHGPQRAALLGGYLRDTPRELLESLVRLLNDSREERVLFDQEPDAWLLRLRILPGRLLRIEVHFMEGDVPPPDPPAELLFRHTEPADRFAACVFAEFERVVAEGVETDYGYWWGLHPFPCRALDSLGHVLRERNVIPG